MDGVRERLTSEEETAAVTAAYLELRKQRETSVGTVRGKDPMTWRFSSRWWNTPLPITRSRPKKL